MSYWEIRALVRSRRFGSSARKAVISYFAERGNDAGKGVYASKATIALETELGRSTIIRVVNEFVAEGLLVISGKHKVKNGDTIRYDLGLGAISELPLAKPPKTPNPSQSGTSSDRDPSQSGTLPVPERDPNPSQSGTQSPIVSPSDRPEDRAAIPPDDKPPPKARLPNGWIPTNTMVANARNINLTDAEIEDFADDFRTYWIDRRDRDASKSERGWERAWINRLKAVGHQIIRSRNMAGKPNTQGHGQGGSLASIAAQRRASGQV